ncbi:MAG: hypothetical protein EOM73_09125, partial [Bacteroidia bacterium]|nr:hypothetical protein [Bacteroidia bacterium]
MLQKTGLFRVSFFLLLLVGFTAGAQKVSVVASELQSKMIWIGPDDGKPGYTVFRKTVDLESTEMATFHIFADTKYILWINGTEVLRGPCRFDPAAPSFDSK